MRNDFMSVLHEYFQLDSSIYILDADCARSTKSINLKNLDPDRFINCGISEQNAIGIAVGLSRNNKKVFINGFAAMIIPRGFDQIIQSASLPNIPLTIIGHYSGFSASKEGAPHHAIADIGMMSLLPNVNIYTPFDIYDMRNILRKVIVSKDLNYIRLSRNNNDYSLPIQLNNNVFIRQFFYESGDICIVSYGQILNECIKAITLYKGNKKISLINIVSFHQHENYLQKLLRRFTKILVVEDHLESGGLYSMILLKTNIEKSKLYHICIKNYTETGDNDWLLEKYGMNSHSIVEVLENWEVSN